MDDNRINALVATAFNLAAADEPSLRSVHPGGMTPAIADSLPKSVKAGWIESYAQRLHAGELKKHEPLLYGAVDVQCALDQLGHSF
jgi:hypothetical protein